MVTKGYFQQSLSYSNPASRSVSFSKNRSYAQIATTPAPNTYLAHVFSSAYRSNKPHAPWIQNQMEKQCDTVVGDYHTKLRTVVILLNVLDAGALVINA